MLDARETVVSHVFANFCFSCRVCDGVRCGTRHSIICEESIASDLAQPISDVTSSPDTSTACGLAAGNTAGDGEALRGAQRRSGPPLAGTPGGAGDAALHAEEGAGGELRVESMELIREHVCKLWK